MKYSLVIAALTAAAHAATVKGTVREIPDNAPIAGVQVTLGQQGETRATAYTGNDGAYEFRDVKPGDYDVEVAKTGYWWSDGGSYMLPAGGLNVSVAEDSSAVTRDMQMARPGKLRGRVLDEDGKPIEGLTLGLGLAGAVSYSSTSQTTDAEGRFVFEKLIANRYVVQAGPRSVFTAALTDYTEVDIGKVDEDYPVTYWPGGSTDPAARLSAVVPPGGDIDIGDLRPRKVPLYRTLVRLADEACEGNLSLNLMQPTAANPQGVTPSYAVPCAPEYLFTGLAAGRWRLRVTKQERWALTEFDAGPDARPVDLRMQDRVRVDVRLVPGEGVGPLPPLSGAVGITPDTPGLPSVSVSIGPEGSVSREGAFGVPSRVRASLFSTATLLNTPFYAAEFRYGGSPVVNGTIIPTAGAELEIVIDDKPGTITGTYSGGDRNIIIFVHQPRNGRLSDLDRRAPGVDGRFSLQNLAPGDYRIVAVSLETIRGGQLDRVLANGQTVTVRRGETTNVSLRVQ